MINKYVLLTTLVLALSSMIPPVKHTLLLVSNAGRYRNYNFLVEGLGNDTQKIKAALQELKDQYCSDGMCNTMTVWNNPTSFRLEGYRLKNQPTTKSWNKQNWVKLSEGLVVFYTVSVNEAAVFPYLNDTYRENGGKKTRPNPKHFDL